MAVFKSGCFRAKWLYLGKIVLQLRAKWLYWAKVVVFGQKWLYSGCCIQAKMVVIGQVFLYSGKSGCIRAKWFYSGKYGCNRAGLLYSKEVFLFLQKVIVSGD